jgi:hypothetical protein
MPGRGTKVVTSEEAREIADLYAWGMEVWMIAAFYGIHKVTVLDVRRKAGVPARPNGAPRHIDLDATSTRRRKREPEKLAPNDRFEDAYRVVREHARALRDKRTAQRPADGNTRSYLGGAS